MKLFKVRICFPILLMLVLFSCAAPQKTIYFRNTAQIDSMAVTVDGPAEREVVIKQDDILAINVTSISTLSVTDPVGIFKNGGTATAASNPGYLVDNEGNIDYPALGKLKLAGLTIRQAKETLAKRLKEYVQEPVVEVRIINFRITMLGEVGSQGMITAPNHKINIVEAIAQAGGIPITGRRDNVMVIREEDGKRKIAHLNLGSREVFSSPYYYLQQNDIVYVEPSKVRRQENNEFTRIYLPLATSLLSAIITIYAFSQVVK